MAAEYHLIQTQSDIDSLASKTPSTLAFDTEFTRRRTYLPIPELLQILFDGEIYLIDLQRGLNLKGIAEWFQDSSIRRIAHSVDQDIDVLNLLFSGQIGVIEDTQLAHAMLISSQPFSYSRLVQEMFDVELSKTQQKSNWSKRPFSTTQLEYAANDIRYLPQMWDRLHQSLVELDRLEWYEEERDRRERMDSSDPLRIPGSISKLSNLSAIDMAFLMRMDQLRMRRAEQVDKPKNWILSTDSMIRIANRQVLSPRFLRTVLSESQNRTFGHRIRQMRAKATKQHQSSQAVPLGDLVEVGGQLKSICDAISESQKVSSVLLAQKDVLFALQAYVSNGSLPIWFGQWRTDLIGSEIQKTGDVFLSQYTAVER